MINIQKAKYRGYCCENYSLIEGYNEAITSEKKYCLHHRLETHNSDGELRSVFLTREELEALEMLYNRPASELIFMPLGEHTALHNKSKKGSIPYNKGKKGLWSPTEECKRKVSDALKGLKRTEEQKNHYSVASKKRQRDSNGRFC